MLFKSVIKMFIVALMMTREVLSQHVITQRIDLKETVINYLKKFNIQK